MSLTSSPRPMANSDSLGMMAALHSSVLQAHVSVDTPNTSAVLHSSVILEAPQDLTIAAMKII